jgi:hypothetical protein
MTTASSLAAAVLADVLVRDHGATLRPLPNNACPDCRVLAGVPVSEWAICNERLMQFRNTPTIAAWVIRCAACDADRSQSRTHFYEREAYTPDDTYDACPCPRCGYELGDDFFVVRK